MTVSMYLRPYLPYLQRIEMVLECTLLVLVFIYLVALI